MINGSRGVTVYTDMEVTAGIYNLGGRVGAHVRAFVLDAGDELIVIDTLFTTHARPILAQVDAIGRSVRDVKHIIMTHAHRSHLGGLAKLAELSGAPVYAHEWRSDIVAGQRAAQSVSWLPHSPIQSYPFQLGNNLNISKHRAREVDHFIHEGDPIGPLQVVHAPGHSPGHLAFWWEEKKALFVGDAVVTWPRFELGWRGFLLNPTQHRASVRRLAEFDTEIMCTGHGDPLISGAAGMIRPALPQLD
jgi:glyoxylase-like metal-dependent hydrolase (beta-lactamase superfamily II)